MGRGPGESVVHGPRTSSLRHCVSLLPSQNLIDAIAPGGHSNVKGGIRLVQKFT